MADESYKQEFLQTVDGFKKAQELSQTQQNLSQTQQHLQQTQPRSNIGSLTKITNTNDIWSTERYQAGGWRKQLQTSYYNTEHHDGHYALVNKLNPEVERSENNMRVTPISEYSNALHNNRIFINPKFTSC